MTNGVGEQATILLVDDQSANLAVLGSILAPLGCRLLVAKSGGQALKLARSHQPALILLDILMPEMDGFEVCRQLCSQPETRQSCVIFLSALDDQESRVRGLELGGSDFISKPFHPQEVLARVRCHLEQWMLKSALQAQNAELLELQTRQNLLISMAAHDLRTPLTGLIGAADFLLMEITDVGHQELLELVKVAGLNMQRLVEELLDAAAVKASQPRLEREKAVLSQLLKERLLLQKRRAEQRGITLEVEWAATPALDIDRAKIGQVIDNLISNAIKYSSAGSRIQVSLEAEAQWQRLQVRDAGTGIAPEQLERIFEPHFRAQSSQDGSESSYGLGLAIAKKIAESHQGYIRVESQLGQGSTFTLELPVKI